MAQECNFWGDEVGKCTAAEKYPGLWEVPLYFLQDGDKLYGGSGEAVLLGGGVFCVARSCCPCSKKS